MIAPVDLLPVAKQAAVVAAVVAVAGTATPGILRRFQLLDHPNARSSHTHAPARGGGLIIIAGALTLVAWISAPPMPAGLWLAAVLVAGISFADDVKGMPARLRLAVHLVAGWLVAVEPQVINDPLLAAWPWAIVVVIGVTGYVNAFNFMDGINGLAAAQAIVTGVGAVLLNAAAGGGVLSWPAVLALGCAAGGLGFLPHNAPRARMFMGDVGSATLGFLLAASAVALASRHGERMVIPVILLHLNFILETSITLLRRIWRRERWFEAHREHFYQRLVRSGFPHWTVTGGYAAIQCAVVGAALQAWAAPLAAQLVWLGGVTAVWLTVFGWSERQFKAVSTQRS